MMFKKLLSLSIVLIALSIMIYSCGSSDSTGIKTSEVALSEYAFKDDASLHAQFSHVTVVDFEHSQETNINEKDSGSPGVDIIPFMVIFGQNHTFEFEDMGNGNHYAILRNENEEEVTRIDANGTPVTVQLLAGKYKLYLHNMGTETFPLFLQPVTIDTGSLRQASYNPFSLWRVKVWKSCEGCNLSGANLYQANLYRADLSYANLEGAELGWANLKEADLLGADLLNANLPYANLYNAYLGGTCWAPAPDEYPDLYTCHPRTDFGDPDYKPANVDCVIWIDGTTCGAGAYVGYTKDDLAVAGCYEGNLEPCSHTY